MYNIDVIMDMMSWDSDKEEQKKGIELAKNIKCLDAFVQPNNNVHGKDVWENCAIVLSAKSDNDLKPHVFDLLEWLEDINWPGAECIYERLYNYKDKEWLNFCIDNTLDFARVMEKNEGYDQWKDNLLKLRKNIDIKNFFLEE